MRLPRKGVYAGPLPIFQVGRLVSVIELNELSMWSGFPPFGRWPFRCADGFFAVQKAFSWMWSRSLSSAFTGLASGVEFAEPL